MHEDYGVRVWFKTNKINGKKVSQLIKWHDLKIGPDEIIKQAKKELISLDIDHIKYYVIGIQLNLAPTD